MAVSKRGANGRMMPVVGLLVAILVVWVIASNSSPRGDVPASRPRHGSGGQKWYDGGTLHGATLREWRQASYANKLATCGDFVSRVFGTRLGSMDAVRLKAEELLNAIEQVAVDERLGRQTVAETAAASAVLLGWHKDR